MTTAEAIAVIERFAPKPSFAPSERCWPLAIITACGNVDRMSNSDDLDLMTEAISVLTGIPFTKLLSAAEIVEATPPLPRGLEEQGGADEPGNSRERRRRRRGVSEHGDEGVTAENQHGEPQVPASAIDLGNMPAPLPPRVQVVTDFFDAWRFCPVSSAETPAPLVIADAARQLLAALDEQAASEDESIDNRIERAARAMCELGHGEKWDAQEHHDKEHFRQLARAAAGVFGFVADPITADEARTLHAVWAGDAFDAEHLDSVQPKLEAIAGESWR